MCSIVRAPPKFRTPDAVVAEAFNLATMTSDLVADVAIGARVVALLTGTSLWAAGHKFDPIFQRAAPLA